MFVPFSTNSLQESLAVFILVVLVTSNVAARRKCDANAACSGTLAVFYLQRHQIRFETLAFSSSVFLAVGSLYCGY